MEQNLRTGSPCGQEHGSPWGMGTGTWASNGGRDGSRAPRGPHRLLYISARRFPQNHSNTELCHHLGQGKQDTYGHTQPYSSTTAACSWEESWLGVGKTQELVSGMTYWLEYFLRCAIRAFTHNQHDSYRQYTTVQKFEISKFFQM